MGRLTPWFLLAALVAVSGSYGLGRWQGYGNGYDAAEAAQERDRQATQQELFRLGDLVSRKAAELETLTAEREDLVQSLEDAARTAPGADRSGVGADGLRRLEQRWGAP